MVFFEEHFSEIVKSRSWWSQALPLGEIIFYPDVFTFQRDSLFSMEDCSEHNRIVFCEIFELGFAVKLFVALPDSKTIERWLSSKIFSGSFVGKK